MNDNEIWVVDQFRHGELVFISPEQNKHGLTDEEIIQADKNHELVAVYELGSHTLFGNCKECEWRGHEHFVVGDDEREMSYDHLESAHASTGCLKELEFKELSR